MQNSCVFLLEIGKKIAKLLDVAGRDVVELDSEIKVGAEIRFHSIAPHDIVEEVVFEGERKRHQKLHIQRLATEDGVNIGALIIYPASQLRHAKTAFVESLFHQFAYM